MMHQWQSRKTKNRKDFVKTTDLEMVTNSKLQEQLRLLQLENNILRQNIEELERKMSDIVMQSTSQSTPKSSVEKSNCGCKGKCSSRICGCVKKNSKCNSSCKCDNTMCQNQEAKRSDENKENKEDIDRNNMETPKKQTLTIRRTRTNVTAKETKKPKSIFNPAECKSEVTFDPMKPRHQLSRTPPSMKKVADDILVNKDDTIKTLSQFQSQSQSCCKSVEENIISSNTEEIAAKEEAVDWEQHTAQLVPCKKCKRTFMPDRIQKHEACCKKI